MQEEAGLEIINLWPGQAPGSADVTVVERSVERSTEVGIRDRAVDGVTRPRLEVFRPAKPNGTAIVLAPGGGYQRLIIDKEGYEVARWLVAIGITVFVLRYRLPGEGHERSRDVPLQDAQRALRLIRANAAEFGVAPWHVGVMGFSAGGHVAATLANGFARKVYAPIDVVDDTSARPDFCALAYPVISMDEAIAHAGSRQSLLGTEPTHADVLAYSCDTMVAIDGPPTFIALANDDGSVPADHSLRYYMALREHGISTEFHCFQHGEHGFGLRRAGEPVGVWTSLFESWARSNGWL
ncbi:alpha/beta hydrolase [Uliginosibacterium sp. sgz301328]|uniref:alpha/beta hydrolase n=1 Tax=Uliginosibacterium sp. sgz301328 TaxID=3243764 RepID=UPI00359D9737